jgi:hypothetical protein
VPRPHLPGRRGRGLGTVGEHLRGAVIPRIETERTCFAWMLGRPDRQTLFLVTAHSRGTEKMDEAVADRTGRVPVTGARAVATGWP